MRVLASMRSSVMKAGSGSSYGGGGGPVSSPARKGGGGSYPGGGATKEGGGSGGGSCCTSLGAGFDFRAQAGAGGFRNQATAQAAMATPHDARLDMGAGYVGPRRQA